MDEQDVFCLRRDLVCQTQGFQSTLKTRLQPASLSWHLFCDLGTIILFSKLVSY